MYLLIEISHNIDIQSHEYNIAVGKLEIEILRNYFQKNLGVLRGDFLGFGCPNDALMPSWLRL